MIRRVLNLVVENASTGVHSVRRIDPYKHLFYRSADEAAAANANKGMVDRAAGMQTLVLPEPAVSFAPSPTAPLPYMGGLDLFALLGTRGSEGRIVSANVAGESVLYDVDEHLFLSLPWLNKPKGFQPVCISPENSLYAMERCTGGTMQDNTSSCFEVLEYGPRHGGDEVRCATCTEAGAGGLSRRLPSSSGPATSPPTPASPPTRAPSTPTAAPPSTYHGRGANLRKNIGTYCFDTSRHVEEWRHVGEWTMPLHGGAHYVPEFDLWFGFSARSPNFHLCALDLSAMARDQQQPVVQHVFEDLNTPTGEDWGLMTAELVSLGAGKFCVAKSFNADNTLFAVLTGIEIVRGDDHGVHMVRHKRTCYYFFEDEIKCVL